MSVRCFKVFLVTATLLISGGQSRPLLAGEAVSADPRALPEANDPVVSALAEARDIGSLSFLASVVENVRLTPGRRDHIASVARAIRPDLEVAINKAVMLSAMMGGSRQRPAGPWLAATDRGARQQPFPGGNPDIPIASLSEYQRNYSLSAMHADAALAQGYTGKGVTVGIVDSGIDIRPDGTVHPEFEGRIDPRSTSLVYYFDPTNLDGRQNVTQEEFNQAFQQPANASMDQYGHGTHVAGIIGAGNNGFGMQGVAPGVNLLAVKVGGAPDGEFLLANGVEVDSAMAARCGPALWYETCDPLYSNSRHDYLAGNRYLAQFPDVKVINGSFGTIPARPFGDTWDISDPDFQEYLSHVAQTYLANIDAGQIFVQAAGNDRDLNEVKGENPLLDGLLPFIRPDHEAATNSSGARIYDDGGAGLDYSFLSPEALDAREKAEGRALGRYIVVVATDAYNNLASYSQKCGVARMWCIAAPGGDQGTEVPDRGIYSTLPNNDYGAYSGTSMAAPNVSGALAVLIEAFPTFTPRQIVALLFRTAEDLGAPGIDDVYGWGLARLDRALAGGPAGLTGQGIYVAGRNDADNVWIVDFKSEGGLEKQGNGTLVIAEDIAFAKATTIREGRFAVDGTFTTPALEVAQQGALLGSGVINADTTVAGTLSPGSGIGVLTVNGNLDLKDTAVTEIAFVDAQARVYDSILLKKPGTVFTAGGVLAPSLDEQREPLRPGTPYAFVSAPEGRVEGSFQGLRQPGKGLQAGTRLDVLYYQNALALTATPAQYADLGILGVRQSSNGRSFGQAVDAIRPAAGQRPDEDIDGLFATLYAADTGSLESGFSTLPAEVQAMTGAVALRSVDRFAGALFARQSELASGRAEGDREILAYGDASLWIKGDYAGSSLGTMDGIAGFDTTATTTAFGIDWMTGLGPVGIAGAQDLSKVEAGPASGTVSTYQLGAYSLLETAPFDIALSGGLAYGDLSTSREASLGTYSSVATASGHGFGGFAEGAILRSFDVDGSLVTPSAQIGYRTFDRHDMAEKGGIFAVDTPDQFYQNTHTTLSLTASKAFYRDGGMVLEPAVKLGWRYDFGDIDAATMLGFYGATYQVQTAPIGRNAFIGDVSFTAMDKARFSVSLHYQLELRENYSSNTFSAKALLRF